jgi:hypothetical protein
MKSSLKIVKLKLDVEQVNDYVLIGIVSSEPDYKLSLSLNKKFGISLKNGIPVKLAGESVAGISFSRFSNNNEYSEFIVNLIANRSGNNYLLGKLKNIDYLLQMQDSENEINLNKITSSLREIDSVTAVFNIDVNAIKDKNLHYLNQ